MGKKPMKTLGVATMKKSTIHATPSINAKNHTNPYEIATLSTSRHIGPSIEYDVVEYFKKRKFNILLFEMC